MKAFYNWRSLYLIVTARKELAIRGPSHRGHNISMFQFHFYIKPHFQRFGEKLVLVLYALLTIMKGRRLTRVELILQKQTRRFQ